MKASIKSSKVVITLEMTQKQFDLIKQGIGNTSSTGRIQCGMTKDQSDAIEDLYCALDDAKQD